VANKRSSQKSKIVLASGVFDLLHLEHVRFLEEAKRAGGRSAELVVIVDRDSVARERKGKKPIVPENQRCALVASLRVVNCAMLGFQTFNIGRVIDKVKPDVIALGYDQSIMLERTVKRYIEDNRLNIKVVRIGKFGEDELNSSSKIKQRIIEDFKR
jgi:FAD synthetase